MTKAEKEKLNKMLDKAVESYFLFANREDFDQPCVKRNSRKAKCRFQYSRLSS